jgi:hypothetical protein
MCQLPTFVLQKRKAHHSSNLPFWLERPRSSSRAPRGLTVIGTAGTERGPQIGPLRGGHHVLDRTAPGYLEECVRLSEPRLRTNVEEQVLRHDTAIEP